MKILKLTLVVVLALAAAACSWHLDRPDTSPPQPIHSSYEIRRDLLVTPAEWPQALLADVYRPHGAGPFPSVLLIHGGAWKRGDRAQVSGLAERLAERGYLVVNTTYRFAPRFTWPAQLQDVQEAVRWMRGPGKEQGVDPERIGTFGYSAGAHLAALIGGAADDPVLGDARTKVRAVVAGGTPADLSKYEGGRLIPNFMGGSREDRLPDYLAASPVSHVNAGDPPIFLYHGSLDDLVPPDHATDYKALLDRAGITNELFIIRGHGHFSAFFADGEAVQAAIAFLDRHLR
ncbi:MAG: alpha/beta hydrolase fold domain-containing protein [Panacagrimonas sp.]